MEIQHMKNTGLNQQNVLHTGNNSNHTNQLFNTLNTSGLNNIVPSNGTVPKNNGKPNGTVNRNNGTVPKNNGKPNGTVNRNNGTVPKNNGKPNGTVPKNNGKPNGNATKQPHGTVPKNNGKPNGNSNGISDENINKAITVIDRIMEHGTPKHKTQSLKLLQTMLAKKHH